MSARRAQLIAVIGNVLICDFRREPETATVDPALSPQERLAAIRRTILSIEHACRELSSMNSAALREAENHAVDLAGVLGLLDEISFRAGELAEEASAGSDAQEACATHFLLSEGARVTAELHVSAQDLAYRIDASAAGVRAARIQLRAIAERVAMRSDTARALLAERAAGTPGQAEADHRR